MNARGSGNTGAYSKATKSLLHSTIVCLILEEGDRIATLPSIDGEAKCLDGVPDNQDWWWVSTWKQHGQYGGF